MVLVLPLALTLSTVAPETKLAARVAGDAGGAPSG